MFQHVSDRIFGATVDWSNDYAMSMRLYDLVERHHLTPVARACLLLNIHGGDPPSAQTLDLFERPTPACLNTAAIRARALPLLFHLRVDRLTGTVSTDQGTPGRYHPLAG